LAYKSSFSAVLLDPYKRRD